MGCHLRLGADFLSWDALCTSKEGETLYSFISFECFNHQNKEVHFIIYNNLINHDKDLKL